LADILIMEIKIGKSNGTLLVKVFGQLMEPEQELFKRLIDEVSKNTTDPKIIFDFSFLLRMSSSGLGKLIVLHKRLAEQERRFAIHGINENLFSFFQGIHLEKMIEINKDSYQNDFSFSTFKI